MGFRAVLLGSAGCLHFVLARAYQLTPYRLNLSILKI